MMLLLRAMKTMTTVAVEKERLAKEKERLKEKADRKEAEDKVAAVKRALLNAIIWREDA
jgi:hypothetical protein